MKIIINNFQKKIPLTKEMRKTAISALNKAAEVYALNPRTEVSLTLVDDEYIQKLNHMYRGKDSPTDVLSFAMNDAPEESGSPEILNDPQYSHELEILLGDIIISLETAARQADEYGHSLLRELTFLVTHGMLHLLGYDHEEETEREEMRREEKHILSFLEIT